jgi:hypothetical protein
MAVWFRRSINPGLLLASLLILALTAAGAAALVAAAGDGSAAGDRFSDYLAVARARTDSYDADGAATRFLLMPDTGTTALNADIATTNKDLAALGSDPQIQEATTRWRKVVNTDLAAVAADAVSDPATALVRDTGTARGQEAFDFFYYDSVLTSVSDQRLAAFNTAMSAARDDLSGWSWLPWVLVGCALAGLALGVRPRLAEYR